MKIKGTLNNKTCLFVIAIFCISIQLQGCMNAAVSGAQAVYNRKSWNNTLHAHYVSMRANQAIYWDTDKFKDTHIEVNSFNDVVLITGEVPSSEVRSEIYNIVKQVADTDEIYNATQIMQPTSSLIRVSDSWITAKVKTKILSSNNIDPGQINIITENGTVFLMGIVFHDQADEAVELARDTDGVKNVVKVFSYLNLSKK